MFIDKSSNKVKETIIKTFSSGTEIVTPKTAYSSDHQKYLVV